MYEFVGVVYHLFSTANCFFFRLFLENPNPLVFFFFGWLLNMTADCIAMLIMYGRHISSRTLDLGIFFFACCCSSEKQFYFSFFYLYRSKWKLKLKMWKKKVRFHMLMREWFIVVDLLRWSVWRGQGLSSTNMWENECWWVIWWKALYVTVNVASGVVFIRNVFCSAYKWKKACG